ncbi:hypothetical protein GCM10023178_27750 [Actinomadura luteofluorescens]
MEYPVINAQTRTGPDPRARRENEAAHVSARTPFQVTASGVKPVARLGPLPGEDEAGEARSLSPSDRPRKAGAGMESTTADAGVGHERAVSWAPPGRPSPNTAPILKRCALTR